MDVRARTPSQGYFENVWVAGEATLTLTDLKQRLGACCGLPHLNPIKCIRMAGSVGDECAQFSAY